MLQVVLLTLFTFFSQSAPPVAGGRVLNLALPHHLGAGETVFLEVEVGVIAKGEEIEIATPSGQSLGTISPYGIKSGQPAGTYTVPLPANAVSDNHVSVRVSVSGYGHPDRAPTAKEVRAIHVKIMPAK
jgi:hypothetical protein